MHCARPGLAATHSKGRQPGPHLAPGCQPRAAPPHLPKKKDGILDGSTPRLTNHRGALRWRHSRAHWVPHDRNLLVAPTHISTHPVNRHCRSAPGKHRHEACPSKGFTQLNLAACLKHTAAIGTTSPQPATTSAAVSDVVTGSQTGPAHTDLSDLLCDA